MKKKLIKTMLILCNSILFLNFSKLNIMAVNSTKVSKTAQPKKNLKKELMTTKKYILKEIRSKKKDEEIVKNYFKLPREEINDIIKNDEKNNINIICTDKETERINSIEGTIKSKEKELVTALMTFPDSNNKDKPIVILNPGHGFKETGAMAKDEKGNSIKESELNAKIVYYLTLLLLKQDFEVYLVFDLRYAKIKLPKHPSLHILFNTRPPIIGEERKNRMCDASAFSIKQIITLLKEKNKNSKIASVCIHHNTAANTDAYGFISFYTKNYKTCENFEKNSNRLAKICFKYCKKVFKPKNGTDCGKVKTDNWLVCHFGSKKERTEKKFNDEAAVLLELGFMSNKEELKKILDKKYKKRMAKALTVSLCKYFKKKIKKQDNKTAQNNKTTNKEASQTKK